MKKQTLKSVVLAAMLVAGMAGTANAVTVTTAGAKTTTAVVATYNWNVSSYDTSYADGHFVSAPWHATNGVSGSVVNKKGAGSVTEGVAGNASARLDKVKACRSNSGILPMTCSNWALTGY